MVCIRKVSKDIGITVRKSGTVPTVNPILFGHFLGIPSLFVLSFYTSLGEYGYATAACRYAELLGMYISGDRLRQLNSMLYTILLWSGSRDKV